MQLLVQTDVQLVCRYFKNTNAQIRNDVDDIDLLLEMLQAIKKVRR